MQNCLLTECTGALPFNSGGWSAEIDALGARAWRIARMLRTAASCVASAGIGAGVLYILRRRRRLEAIADAECYELKGEYYQVIGHAWDHQTKDFKVIYRPLYHCPSAVDRFEAHMLAASHFERWGDKFKRVPLSSLPAAAARRVLAGPFVHDPEWTGAPR